jgi:hypothetical protein
MSWDWVWSYFLNNSIRIESEKGPDHNSHNHNNNSHNNNNNNHNSHNNNSQDRIRLRNSKNTQGNGMPHSNKECCNLQWFGSISLLLLLLILLLLLLIIPILQRYSYMLRHCKYIWRSGVYCDICISLSISRSLSLYICEDHVISRSCDSCDLLWK